VREPWSEPLELWLRAATRCAARYALREADQAYAESLRILSALPTTAERDARELEILAARGAIQQALYGYAAEPVVTTYARADELCQSLDTVPFPVIRGVWNVHVMKGDKPATLKYAERIGALLSAERLSRLDRSMAHNCLGTFYWFTGEWQRCLHHYEAAAYQTRDHALMVATYGGCGGAYARILGPYGRAVLGGLGRAKQESTEVVAVMRRAGRSVFACHGAALRRDARSGELGDLDRAFSAARRAVLALPGARFRAALAAGEHHRGRRQGAPRKRLGIAEGDRRQPHAARRRGCAHAGRLLG